MLIYLIDGWVWMDGLKQNSGIANHTKPICGRFYSRYYASKDNRRYHQQLEWECSSHARRYRYCPANRERTVVRKLGLYICEIYPAYLARDYGAKICEASIRVRIFDLCKGVNLADIRARLRCQRCADRGSNFWR
jgi:hypothetical protein